MTNREIRQRFQLFAELLQLHDGDDRLSKILAGASFRLGQMSEQVSDLAADELKKNFRPEIVKLIKEINTTQTINELDELIQLTPQGLFEMMRIKGLGGKKLSIIWKKAGIDSIEKLIEACRAGKISALPGFGKKTESNIIASIEEIRSGEKLFHYGFIAEDAENLLELLKKTFKKNRISLCGDIRRKANVVEAIEILTDLTFTQIDANRHIRGKIILEKPEENITHGHTLNENPVVIYHCDTASFYNQLFTLTGKDEHVKKVLNVKLKKTFRSEEEIYKEAGLKYIVPEMREDVAEWTFIKKHDTNELITEDDIKGVVHNHTTWSDGIDSLKDFVTACKKKNYEYTVISDHSKNAHYAGGLKEAQVLKQQKEIDELNAKLSPFHIFKSIECDILVSGELDYGNDFLKNFDLVIISVHQLLKMDEDKATKRLIKAIENPYTAILGHMTGRQLLIRPGYPLNFKKVIDACAANNVVIEINANPYRLDVDWKHIPYILDKGIMISVNPDAHSIPEIDNIRWGVESARKAGLTKQMTWNAQPLSKIKQWIAKKRK